MIRIANAPSGIPIASLKGKQREIYLAMQASSEIFYYEEAAILLFELILRENIIKAALELNKSGAVFTSFEYSAFNPAYWVRSSYGYLLRPDVLPSEAIRDIFVNGKKYGFECSTAMILIYYKAVLDSIRESDFNYLFGGLLVWNWNNDPDLVIITRSGREFIPGDIVYFYNPDYQLPIWRGENGVVLGNDQYYGHGIGVKTAKGMIESLNTRRRPGAKRSAYMLNQHSRLNARYLFRFSKKQLFFREKG
ncbi:protein-glutamine gamma-glutamyltransferase [Mesobacillus foraminis]|uniref:Protein-glutamine gamma-glutamyltransferase n=1 Tax=Mesobacillus foraminis TaxID=279826 RepID=A0A4R2BKM2_9BACI|nr:protein-glutamine gamma-glutamyltransferase [Mesobacillus foraminis]TCN27751.1 protein-glutamine gamma-glutamyltransferase [Mesobacillus foraminis]